jgi:phosphoglucosamine mutase
MRRSGYNLGGEQSGHVIFLDHNTTGDGLLTALQVLAVLRRKERPLSELVGGIERFPQVLLNVAVAEQRPIEQLPELVRLIRRVEAELAGRGRVLIRYSGTERKARVMVEGEDEARVRAYADELAATLRRALAGGR